WTVLSRLRSDLSTRHIPVHIISTDEDCERGLKLGARSVLAKPIKSKEILDAAFEAIGRGVGRHQQRLLVVSTDNGQQRIAELLTLDGLRLTIVENADQGIAAIGGGRVDGIVVASALDAASGLEIVTQLTSEAPGLPIILYSSPTQSNREEQHLRRLLGSARLRNVQSLDRLLGARRSRPCTTTTPCSPAAPCWWSTTTSATSSRSPACWSAPRWSSSPPRPAGR